MASTLPVRRRIFHAELQFRAKTGSVGEGDDMPSPTLSSAASSPSPQGIRFPAGRWDVVKSVNSLLEEEHQSVVLSVSSDGGYSVLQRTDRWRRVETMGTDIASLIFIPNPEGILHFPQDTMARRDGHEGWIVGDYWIPGTWFSVDAHPEQGQSTKISVPCGPIDLSASYLREAAKPLGPCYFVLDEMEQGEERCWDIVAQATLNPQGR
jgi:hypothetical protein